ncbi:unnamed protein product [Owenia fusiformis]|uniref:C2H2-type domain-containing protein n=1 Tax=Owenia fusiformis TaxID=6347 RepID=A0A8S4P5F3_OWEFU|nr:unnamed protein product [Owenia fusiformis]
MTLVQHESGCDVTVAKDEVTIKVESQIVDGKKVMKKSFICQCGKTFNQRYLWQRHNVQHTGSRNFICDICNKAFGLSSTLNRHKVVHADESQRKHKCPTCDKAFHLSGVLRDHIKTHTRDVTFDCAHCGKKFLKKTNLGHHLDVMHTEKSISCGSCPKKFPTESILKAHTLQWHRTQQQQCQYCNLQVNSKWELSQHEQHCDALRPIKRKPSCNTVHLNNGLKTIKISYPSSRKSRKDKERKEGITASDTVTSVTHTEVGGKEQSSLPSTEALPQQNKSSQPIVTLDQNDEGVQGTVKEPSDKDKTSSSTTSDKDKSSPSTTSDKDKIGPSTTSDNDKTSPSTTSDKDKTSPSTTSDKDKTSPSTTSDKDETSPSTTAQVYSTLVSPISRSQANKTQEKILNMSHAEPQNMNLSVSGIRYVPIVPANSDVTKIDSTGRTQGVRPNINMLAVPAGIKPGSLVIVPGTHPLNSTKNISTKLKANQDMPAISKKKRKPSSIIDKKQNIISSASNKLSKSILQSDVSTSKTIITAMSPHQVETVKKTQKKTVTKPSSLNLTSVTLSKTIIPSSSETQKDSHVVIPKDSPIGMCLHKESPDTPQPYLSQYLSNSDISNFNLEEVCIMSSESVSNPEGGVEIIASNDFSNPEERLIVPIDDVSNVVIIPMSTDNVYEEQDLSINADISNPTEEVLILNEESILTDNIVTSEHIEIPTGDISNHVKAPNDDSLQSSTITSQVIFNPVEREHIEIETIATPDLLVEPSMLTSTKSNRTEMSNAELNPKSESKQKLTFQKKQQKNMKEKLSIQPVKLNEYFNYMLTQIDPESNKIPCEDNNDSNPSSTGVGHIQGQMFDPLENPQETNCKK